MPYYCTFFSYLCRQFPKIAMEDNISLTKLLQQGKAIETIYFGLPIHQDFCIESRSVINGRPEVLS